ncbi:hypothetical protein FSP39_023124 [Pinctada imbricata]|uniref:C2H2-type domain-containing protein n=1 Tax=Pinctada imbricata TaxID=66713 RepID=A0AA88Y1V8_PINIB|nr:hypothetical protein FSP39_023124 [Pinctada imbricata]
MHYDSSKVLECCGEYFKSKAALRDHVSICHKSGYRCHVCSRNFCRKALLRRHLTVHSGEKDFRCPECPYATSHKSNLERHQKIHSKSQRSPSKPLESILEKEENSKNSTCGVTKLFRAIHSHKKCIISRTIPASHQLSQNTSSSNDSNVRKFETAKKDDRIWPNKEHHSIKFGKYSEYDEMPSADNEFEKEYVKTDKVRLSHIAKDLSIEKSMIMTSDDATVQSSDVPFSDQSPLEEEDGVTGHMHSISRLWQRPYKCHWCKKAFSSQAEADAHICRCDPIRSLEIPLTCIVKKNMLDFGDMKCANAGLM